MDAILCLLALAAHTQAIDITVLFTPALHVRLRDSEHGGLNLMIRRYPYNSNGPFESIALIGRNAGTIKHVYQTMGDVVEFENNVTLSISADRERIYHGGQVFNITWEAPKEHMLEDCIKLDPHHWYGGPQPLKHYWPVERLVFSDHPAVRGGLWEPYYLSSNGTFFYFDKRVPLFIEQHTHIKNYACFIARVGYPYSEQRDTAELTYTLGVFDDVKKAHEYAVKYILGKPLRIPDLSMIKHPVWATWARYKTKINHNAVLEFADQINSYGFDKAQFEIDDLWEDCYGSLVVDRSRFPNMKKTVDSLKEKGFRVTIWVHPFINKGCEPWYSEALDKEYVVFSESGSVDGSWWNSNGTTTAYIDFTNPHGRSWYFGRLKTFQKAYGFDGFVFDGGEFNFSPQIPVYQADIRDQPAVITTDYLEAIADFGSAFEVRAAHRTQQLPFFVKMWNKDSHWGFKNGFPTMITTLLQMNIDGYPFVVPDLIGGNGDDYKKPSKELYIRWLQATTFLPVMKFSYAPWDFDNETVAIAKKFVELHLSYFGAIIMACERAIRNGSPVNPPIWWIAPRDQNTYDVWDQYLLGEDILVAPVMEEGSLARDVYLPPGTWLEQGQSSNKLNGGGWLRDYPAPLDTLPFFVKE